MSKKYTDLNETEREDINNIIDNQYKIIRYPDGEIISIRVDGYTRELFFEDVEGYVDWQPLE